MLLPREHHRPFGNTGLTVPPIMFSAAALGNACRVIPDLTKLALCGEWFKHVAPPVFVDIPVDKGNFLAFEKLAFALHRLDVAPEEIIIAVRLAGSNHDRVLTLWNEICQRLGKHHTPQIAILIIDAAAGEVAAATGPNQREEQIRESYQALVELKTAGQIRAIGMAARDWTKIQSIAAQSPLDFVMLLAGPTLLRHPPEQLAWLESLRQQQIAVFAASQFHGGFLVGGSQFDGRPLRRDNDADRSLFSWRTSFVALCEGYGVTPAHACLQFALSIPGITAVLANTSRPERVADNIRAAATPVPQGLWESLKEEGLLSSGAPPSGC